MSTITKSKAPKKSSDVNIKAQTMSMWTPRAARRARGSSTKPAGKAKLKIQVLKP